MTLPTPSDGYVASVDEVAVRLGLDVDTLTDTQTERIEAALWDAQGMVEAELNRPLIPTTQTLSDQIPYLGYDLTSWRAWPRDDIDDDFEVVSSTANGDGTYELVVSVGIDARTIKAIRSWIVAQAVAELRGDPAVTWASLGVSSVSAEGQSVSYATGSVAAGATGQPPRLVALRRWRRHSAYTRTRATPPLWPGNANLDLG